MIYQVLAMSNIVQMQFKPVSNGIWNRNGMEVHSGCHNIFHRSQCMTRVSKFYSNTGVIIIIWRLSHMRQLDQ